MDVHFDVPGEVARQFTAEPGGIARAAVEALAAEGVRSGRLTVYQARQLLGIRSRYEMDGFLKARGLFLNDTMQEVVADVRRRSPSRDDGSCRRYVSPKLSSAHWREIAILQVSTARFSFRLKFWPSCPTSTLRPKC